MLSQIFHFAIVLFLDCNLKVEKMFRLLFLILVLFASCQKSVPLHEKTLRINICADPQTLDPRKARDLTTITLMRMMFEGLTRTSHSGELELALAHNVEISDDSTQFVFHLRKSFWSNGDPVTSDDFAKSWKSILDPAFPTDIAYQLYVIKNGRKAKQGEIDKDQIGIKTPDPYTLVVELEQPTPYFLELVSMTSFFPIPSKTVSETADWGLNAGSLVGNGPFAIESWSHGDQIRIVKNPKYWEADEVKIGRIDLFMVSGDTEMRMFEEGKIDWAGSPLSTIPVDALADLKAKEDLQISPLSGTYFFRVNTADRIKEKKNPLSSPNFRKALAIALNRADIAEHILQGGQMAAKSLVPPEMGLSEEGYFLDNQKETAGSFLVKGLSELNLSLNELEPIVISYSSSEKNASIAQAIQKQWETTLRIRVLLEAVEPKVYFQRLSQKQFQLAAGSWIADFNDPINFLEVFKYKDASTNNTNWESPKYVDLLNQSALSSESGERKRILSEAEGILMDQMPIIPIFHFAMNYLQTDHLEEVALSPIGQIDFRWSTLGN